MAHPPSSHHCLPRGQQLAVNTMELAREGLDSHIGSPPPTEGKDTYGMPAPLSRAEGKGTYGMPAPLSPAGRKGTYGMPAPLSPAGRKGTYGMPAPLSHAKGKGTYAEGKGTYGMPALLSHDEGKSFCGMPAPLSCAEGKGTDSMPALLSPAERKGTYGMPPPRVLKPSEPGDESGEHFPRASMRFQHPVNTPEPQGFGSPSAARGEFYITSSYMYLTLAYAGWNFGQEPPIYISSEEESQPSPVGEVESAHESVCETIRMLLYLLINACSRMIPLSMSRFYKSGPK